ncbi:MAG: DNA replication/repair protein RecF [Alphaproteobacteria bacterium]
MINKLTLTDFRNHKISRIDTRGANNIIIIGENGAGKTAILEAVSMLSGDRGMRGSDMNEIARFGGCGGFSAYADLDDETSVCIYYNSGDSNRHARLDGENTALSNLEKYVSIVWLSPREDRLFVDTASDRRTFFDRLASNFDSSHSGRVSKFSKLLSERAFALKSGRDEKWLNVLDNELSATAISISAMRIQYCGEINYFLENYAMSLTGKIEQLLIDGTTISDAERIYRQYLYDNRNLINDKMVLDGPHKSDFGMFNKDLNLPVYLTSTGQQKKALFTLIMSHAKLLHTKTKRDAIILLDEAAAHLDSASREMFFSSLYSNGAQVWATGLDAASFAKTPNAVFVTCHNGEISNILY